MVFKKGDQAWKMRKDRQIPKDEPVIKVTDIGIVPFEPLPPAEQKDTIRRHTVGMMSAVEALYGPCFTPKCKVCYAAHGWLTKCKCGNKS